MCKQKYWFNQKSFLFDVNVLHLLTNIKKELYLQLGNNFSEILFENKSIILYTYIRTLVCLIVVPYASIFFGKFFSPYACSRAYACIVCEKFWRLYFYLDTMLLLKFEEWQQPIMYTYLLEMLALDASYV